MEFSRAFRIFRYAKFRTSTLRRSKVSLAELAGGTIERKIRRDGFCWVCGSAITRRGDYEGAWQKRGRTRDAEEELICSTASGQMTRFQRATLDPFDRCWMFPWRGSVHGPPTCLCRPLFKMAEVARVQGRLIYDRVFFFFFFFFSSRNPPIWILDWWNERDGDEIFEEKYDEVERCVWDKWRRNFGKILSRVWWKFGFSFFLSLERILRVIVFLEDIWEWKGNDLLLSENENGREWRWRRYGDQWWILFDGIGFSMSILLIRIPSSSKRSNKL